MLNLRSVGRILPMLAAVLVVLLHPTDVPAQGTVGGGNLTLVSFAATSNPGSRDVGLLWNPGTAQASYQLNRVTSNTSGNATIAIPNPVGVIGSQNFFLDTVPASAGTIACYRLVPLAANGAAVGSSDMVCIILGTAQGAVPPNTRVQLNQGPNLIVTWDPVPGASSYIVWGLGTDGVVVAPGTTATLAGSGFLVCAIVLPMSPTGAIIGASNVECGFPGFPSNVSSGGPGPTPTSLPLSPTLTLTPTSANSATPTQTRTPTAVATVTATATPTQSAPASAVRINEIESNGGTPGDWTELFNTGTTPVDISGWIFKDNDDTHNYTIPNGTIIAPGAYYLVEEAAQNFGLGAPDATRLFKPDMTLVDSFSWTAHATTTYGRCPNGTGSFVTTTSSTKGAANDCTVTVKINEIESDAGVPGDWVELFNLGTNPVDLSGFVFRDNDDTHNYLIPNGTTIAAGGYFLLEEAAFGFGLGSADAARLFAPGGTTLVDSFSWTAHATTTYGRCPNGTGSFVTTTSATKGAANACPGDTTGAPWPGSPDIQIVDGNAVFGGNLSGLAYEASGTSAPGVLWAVRNGLGSIFRLLFNGTIWTPDTANGWSAGKTLHYPDGTGNTDSEGVTLSATVGSGIYVSTERNNDVSGTSKLSVLRFDVSGSATSLNATNEWNLTSDLPAVGANLGLEAIAYIPDSFLTSKSFFDETKNHAYLPSEYPNHGDGLFFVGVEANGIIYAYALDHSNNTFTRIATISSGFPGVMDLSFDRELRNFWAVCDDTCNGRSAVLEINAQGRFVVTHVFERPTGMPNFNNEGFTVAAQAECVNNQKPAYWADDTEDGGHAIRRGTVPCAPF